MMIVKSTSYSSHHLHTGRDLRAALITSSKTTYRHAHYVDPLALSPNAFSVTAPSVRTSLSFYSRRYSQQFF